MCDAIELLIDIVLAGLFFLAGWYVRGACERASDDRATLRKGGTP